MPRLWGDRRVVLRFRDRIGARHVRLSGGADWRPDYRRRHPHAPAPRLGGRDGTLTRRGGGRWGSGAGDGTGGEGSCPRGAGGGGWPGGARPLELGTV